MRNQNRMSPYETMMKRLGFKKCQECGHTLSLQEDEAVCPECGAVYSIAMRDRSRDKNKKSKGDYRKSSQRRYESFE